MKRLLFGIGIWLWMVTPSAAQVILNYTTLSAAMTATATTLTLTSASAVGTATVGAPAVGNMLYVEHEAMVITAITGTRVTVNRGQSGTFAAAHATSAQVFTGPGSAFRQADPPLQACTTATMGVRPWINVINGNIWQCVSSKWQGTNIMNLTYNSVTPY